MNKTNSQHQSDKSKAFAAGRQIACDLIRIAAAAHMMKAATSSDSREDPDMDCYGCLDLIKDQIQRLREGPGESLKGQHDEFLIELGKVACLLDLLLDHVGFKKSPAISSVAMLTYTAVKELGEYAESKFPIAAPPSHAAGVAA